MVVSSFGQMKIISYLYVVFYKIFIPWKNERSIRKTPFNTFHLFL